MATQKNTLIESFNLLTDNQKRALHLCVHGGMNVLHYIAHLDSDGIHPKDTLEKYRALEIDNENVYLQYGTRGPTFDNRTMKTLLGQAVSQMEFDRWAEGDTDLFKHLLAHGLDPNELYGAQQHTVAHSVMQWSTFPESRLNLLRLLIEHGADLTIRNTSDKDVEDIALLFIDKQYLSSYYALKILAMCDRTLFVPKTNKIRL